eukprot:6194085-Pleurochrysis_carterae.AAC.1
MRCSRMTSASVLLLLDDRFAAVHLFMGNFTSRLVDVQTRHKRAAPAAASTCAVPKYYLLIASGGAKPYYDYGAYKVLRRHEITWQALLPGAATMVARRMSVVCRNRSLLITTRPLTPRAHDYTTVRTEAESPLYHGVAMRFGVSTQLNRAKMHKCQCQNMQMRMHDDQYRNLPFQSDPRDRGSLRRSRARGSLAFCLRRRQ